MSLKENLDQEFTIKIMSGIMNELGRPRIDTFSVRRGNWKWKDQGVLWFKYCEKVDDQIDGKKKTRHETWNILEVPRERVLSVTQKQVEIYELIESK